MSDSEAPSGYAVPTGTIGTALVQRRKQLGIGMGEAAERIAMSRTTYSSYERDRQRPSVDVIPVLADFLNLSTDELLPLYGATSIAVLRPTLERYLADQSAVAKDAASAVVSAISPIESASTGEVSTGDVASVISMSPARQKDAKSKKKKKKGKHAKG